MYVFVKRHNPNRTVTIEQFELAIDPASTLEQAIEVIRDKYKKEHNIEADITITNLTPNDQPVRLFEDNGLTFEFRNIREIQNEVKADMRAIAVALGLPAKSTSPKTSTPSSPHSAPVAPARITVSAGASALAASDPVHAPSAAVYIKAAASPKAKPEVTMDVALNNFYFNFQKLINACNKRTEEKKPGGIAYIENQLKTWETLKTPQDKLNLLKEMGKKIYEDKYGFLGRLMKLFARDEYVHKTYSILKQFSPTYLGDKEINPELLSGLTTRVTRTLRELSEEKKSLFAHQLSRFLR